MRTGPGRAAEKRLRFIAFTMAADGWNVSYNGMIDITDQISIPANGTVPDLDKQMQAAIKEIRKGKHDHTAYQLKLNHDHLLALPQGSAPIYQPIGKVLYTNITAVSSKMTKKAHMFAYICSDEDGVAGEPNCKYLCHAFKCKDEEAAKEIKFAAETTLKTHKARGKPDKPLAELETDEIQNIVKWWNASKLSQYHYQVAPNKRIVTGVIRFECVSGTSHGQHKLVRLESDVVGEQLVQLLADKFNLTDIAAEEWAIWHKPRSGEPSMLDEDENPIVQSLGWSDPCAGEFMLKKLPKGLQRVASKPTADSPTASSVAASDRGGNTQAKSPANDGLGPVLPYNEDDEDLLLSVMIARQSGSGLGFKLTPSYLLQMCVSYCFQNQSADSLKRLLGKIAAEIEKIISINLGSPEVLLFWSCNSLKLIRCFGVEQQLYDVYSEVAKVSMEGTVENALKTIIALRNNNVPLPTVLQNADWATSPQLRDVITRYYEKLDSTMSKENLQEVVDRITAAMPSPQKQTPSRSRPPTDDMSKLNLDDDGDELPELPVTSTPGAEGTGGGDTSQSNQRLERPGIDALPEEWEELVDQETKHRFFANHLTRQTSWTDPRDTLQTVSLTKGQTGLGLGISGAKRTWDDRLVLGIFVSSLVPNSAAATDGSLREGDEILEVNGHSLIGVSREGAIDFLKQVKFEDTVTLLVSQEPETWTNPANDKANLRHTAL